MKILYFSWLREKIGVPAEEVEVKSETVNDLIKELIKIDQKYALAFEDVKAIRVAVDQKVIQDLNISIKNVKEVAFFPPMTGG
ncbi:MAG: molybdopterin converting factor subunit 1 [Paracoccaceae bacterium]|tara:strand:- start:193 stop:441 length:249 start_codon:yes stop_codon:yes gene_type:complete